MKITVNSKELLADISTVAAVIKTNNLIPILDYIEFKFDESGVELHASDMETSITTLTHPIEFSKEGVVSVQAKTLVSLLKSLKNEVITLTFTDKELKVKGTTGTYKIPTTTDPFPKVPETASNGEFFMPGYVLSTAVEKTQKFVATDDLKPILSGVLIDIKESETTFVATDGKRLARYTSNVGNMDCLQLVVPVKPLELLKGLQDEQVLIKYTENNITFVFGKTVVNGRLIDGTYPAYDRVIPTEFKHDLIISKDELLETVKRVGIFANDASKEVVFDLDGGLLTVTATDNNWATSGREEINVESDSTIKLAFSSAILLDIINNSADGKLKFQFVGPQNPVIVTNSANPALLGLAMPISMS